MLVHTRVAMGRRVFGAAALVILGLVTAIPTPTAWADAPAPAPAFASPCAQIARNTVVTTSITFCARTYRISDADNNGVIVIRPARSGIIVNGNGMTLHGVTDRGYGLWVDNTRGNAVRITGFHTSGYYY